MKDHLNKCLASKLYSLRRQANMKQSELAEKLHISQQAYSKLEAGVTRFNGHIIDTLCDCFHITPEEFLDENAGNAVRDSRSLVEHRAVPSTEKTSDLSLLIMEELAKMREERKMLIEFIKKQAQEYQCERAAFLSQIEKLRRKNYRML